MMDDVDIDNEDRVGKRSVADKEDLIVVSSKRRKEGEETPHQTEVSKHEVNHFQLFGVFG